MNKKKLVATSFLLVMALLISTIASTNMQGRSQADMEPTCLDDLVKYPGMATITHELNETEIAYEVGMLNKFGEVRGLPVDGAFDVRQKMVEKGYIESFFDVFFDVFADVYIVSPDGLYKMVGSFFKGWSRTMHTDGTKALFAGAVLMDVGPPGEFHSIIMATVTNVLPQDQMPGGDPYIIWNAEPYFFVQPWWWVWAPWRRLVYWKYWWYDSHKGPNWFWGYYYWWRIYIRYYFGYWRWWWWWWWHWYYWRCWYWWSISWPYWPY